MAKSRAWDNGERVVGIVFLREEVMDELDIAEERLRSCFFRPDNMEEVSPRVVDDDCKREGGTRGDVGRKRGMTL